MCSCAAPEHLISADVSLLMAGAGKGEGEEGGGAGGREGGGAVFTVMGSGRCWTMAETEERFEHRTSKKNFPFQFSMSSISSTTDSFFLSPSSSLNCCLTNPLFFLPTSLPTSLCSPCLPPCLPVSPSVSRLCVPAFLMSSCWNSPSPSASSSSSLSHHAASLISSVLPSFFRLRSSTMRHTRIFFFSHSVFLSFGGGMESSRTK